MYIPNGVEYIGELCFANSGIGEISLPSTLKEISEDAFRFCSRLKVVRAEEGCAPYVFPYVEDDTDTDWDWDWK